jgi:hypothetical protein
MSLTGCHDLDVIQTLTTDPLSQYHKLLSQLKKFVTNYVDYDPTFVPDKPVKVYK